jgi:hypothetical protein
MANLIRLKQIESASAIEAAAVVGTDFSSSVNEVVSQSIQTQFSQSIITIITNNVGAVLPDGVISSSAQLDGTIIKNLTLSTQNADGYSLIVSGAVSIVDATGLTGSIDGDMDVSVPGQIYLVSGSVPPNDPYVSGSSQSNIIDQGEW